MSKIISKKSLKWIIPIVAVAGAAFFGYQHWKAQKFALPEGIAFGNGRIESKLVDVAAKEPLRVKEILVEEGDRVKPGQVLVRLDTTTLDAELARAKANVAATQERMAIATAAIARRKAEIELARIEVERTRKLVEERAGTQREYDVRKTALETTTAALAEEEARLQTAKQEVEVAQANVATIQTRIDDATLRSPVYGRVLYRLVEPGEVVAPGGKALTLVNLKDIYMEIFLPAQQAAKLKIGAEGRITLDHAPGRAAAGYVSFVSPEAQFTPKQVETRSEREKLMFRVKIQVPEELATYYMDYVKTGVRGVGYVKVDESAVWPYWLQNLVTVPSKKNEQSKEVP
ncbi:Cobalt-zinc-cadmium resistance protein CzcB [Candidatus Brocadiaceae bacterium B188]|nr:HlyD family efflux transporter periplasmic adaptor subunit [Candidatus Brocadia sapporoensis]QQR66222.1 MAG: HlyD family efflux transporter periplasmic adaptor subunit [Candidatus Brocadia sp.]RZV57373.1 MAG: HlyD family efflux transporter periplasmic adaptor subunit [Candidatus Brocadia sp. BROELEC01]TWU53170.1 Cobalt-zinc-cadmium resistance protein CzcB [Candidatus Brocadiaceae bacterium B188]